MAKKNKRIRYFHGLLLKAEDFTLEQDYHIHMRRIHNQGLHTWGIIEGVEVSACPDLKVKVSDGTALSSEIIDEKKVCREISVNDCTPGNPADLSGYKVGENIYITVSYDERKACEEGKEGDEGSEKYIWECGVISHSTTKPTEQGGNLVLARVVRESDDKLCVYDADADGTPLRVYAGAVGGGIHFRVDGKDDNVPYIAGVKGKDARNGLKVDSAFTDISGELQTDSTRIKGGLNVAGNVGIGITGEPAAKLDVAGDIKASGLIEAGKGLKVSAGNVSIGTTGEPAAKLDVTGDIKASGSITAKDCKITGALTLDGAPMENMQAVTKKYVDDQLKESMSKVTIADAEGNFKVGGRIEAGKGLTVKGGDLQAESIKIKNSLIVDSSITAKDCKITGALTLVGEPVEAMHAVAKKYVDDKLNKVTITDEDGNFKVGGRIEAGKGLTVKSGDLQAESIKIKNSLTVDSSITAKDCKITGALTLSGEPAQEMHAVTKKYVDKMKQTVIKEAEENFRIPSKIVLKELNILGNSNMTGSSFIGLIQCHIERAGSLNNAEIAVLQIGVSSYINGEYVTKSIYLNSRGDVGIGKNNPEAKLDVAGGINASGSINGNITNPSSREYKENITDVSSEKAIDLLNGLTPVSYKLKSDKTKEQFLGFIAENVPDIIATPDRKAIIPMNIIAILTRVVKDQQKAIEALKAQIAGAKQHLPLN